MSLEKFESLKPEKNQEGEKEVTYNNRMENLRKLNLDEAEEKKFSELLDTSSEISFTGHSFGAAYGGLVCITGSVNCVGCYGVLINNDGKLCRNGS